MISDLQDPNWGRRTLSSKILVYKATRLHCLRFYDSTQLLQQALDVLQSQSYGNAKIRNLKWRFPTSNKMVTVSQIFQFFKHYSNFNSIIFKLYSYFRNLTLLSIIGRETNKFYKQNKEEREGAATATIEADYVYRG